MLRTFFTKKSLKIYTFPIFHTRAGKHVPKSAVIWLACWNWFYCIFC